MGQTIFSGAGGTVVVPDRALCDRRDGGHLIVNPPREVWERSCLSVPELLRWSLLVAATGRAMLDTLPVLRGGCLNYWEAGNWALNDRTDPVGPKNPEIHRRVHLHIFGRSPNAADPDWRWGEAPRFPNYEDTPARAARFTPLDDGECQRIGERLRSLISNEFRYPEDIEKRP